ncbi:type III secretion system effector XopP [Xanthomonas translucens]|uniref:type III secretion system effector XopP n=1 Tax=Xanthomonas campestris pv. translucens TaxID=343 RepID=UPI00034B2245|nr:type III secretion system effector XopP [Xanthomonas translucens]AKK66770.1 outer protein P [Xanthomonas translucens pv. undulosa]MBC3970749.1 outer protein P [Xanthomonas translucens pv. undulosa]MCT8270799.1 outer protein P [Xanthomonas translucens pv. undulosa]MCT8282230.1 outer protein P [Xanthomonas translucens pv. undulosa]MCT8317843.1 outer protein P [Xanthomonas translucens pv. undulosa]
MPKVRTTKQTPLDPSQSTQSAPIHPDPGATASASTDVVATSAQLSGLAIRPPRPVRASRTNAPASSSANARDVSAALFAPTPASQGPDPFEVLTNALSRLELFNHLATNVAPTDPADTKVLEARLRPGASAIKSARQGLQALAELKMRQRLPLDQVEYHESKLVSHLARAAALNYDLCRKIIKEKMAKELGYVQTEGVAMVALPREAILLQQPESWLALRAHLLDAIAALEEVCRRIKSPMTDQAPPDWLKGQLQLIMATIGSCHAVMQTVRGVIFEIHSKKLCVQASDCGLPQVLDRLREIAKVGSYMDAELGEALEELMNVHLERLSSTEHSLTPERLAMHKSLIAEYAEIRDRVGMQLCVDAAALIEEGNHSRDHLWPTMLELATALSDQRQALLDLCQFAVHDRQLIGAAKAPTEQASASVTPRLSITTPGESSKSRKVRNETPGASSSTAVPARLANDDRSAAQKQSDEVLRGTPLELSLVAELGGDFIKIAKHLGKDTTNVERLIGDARHDAATAFDFARTSMQSWFGSKERLLQLRSKLPRRDQRIAQLDTRLRLLQTIEHDFDQREADALKTDPQPRAPHLQRLLALKGLARVATPNRLPSEGDRGNRGRLFEVRIDHTPQSNGNLPAPWFVHLHTENLVTPAALRSLPYKDFTAVHLKTAREVNLGSRWEEVMRALGNTDAKVHRATIGVKLLGQLWAAGSGGQR